MDVPVLMEKVIRPMDIMVIISRVAAYNSYSSDGSFYGLQSCDFQSAKEEKCLTITVRAGSRLPKSL